MGSCMLCTQSERCFVLPATEADSPQHWVSSCPWLRKCPLSEAFNGGSKFLAQTHHSYPMPLDYTLTETQVMWGNKRQEKGGKKT